MPDAVLISIAEAMKDALNTASGDGTLSQTFTATRAYLPTFELRSLTTLTVTVWPNDQVNAFKTRGANERQYTVDVAVMKKVEVSDNAVVDPLMYLVEQIGGLFHGKALTGYTSANCLGWELQPIIAWEHMAQNRQFTSVLRFTFKVVA